MMSIDSSYSAPSDGIDCQEFQIAQSNNAKHYVNMWRYLWHSLSFSDVYESSYVLYHKVQAVVWSVHTLQVETSEVVHWARIHYGVQYGVDNDSGA